MLSFIGAGMAMVPLHSNRTLTKMMCISSSHWVEDPGWYKKKQAESDMGNKPVNSTHPWPLHWFLPLGSCIEFLLCLPLDDGIRGNKVLHPQVDYGHGALSQQ